MEFAHVAARAGAKCLIAQREPEILTSFDKEVAEKLRHATQAIGIAIHCDTCITSIAQTDNDTLIAKCDETDWQAEADMVVHGAGRVPSLDGLNLDAAGIEYDESGVHVNQYFQSVSNPAVYACGDVAATSGLKLTPTANLESHAMTHNLLHGSRHTVDYTGTATVVFTDPPLASVGLTEAQADEEGLNVRVRRGDASKWKINRQLGVEHAFFSRP